MKLWKKILLLGVVGIGIFALYIYIQLRVLEVEQLSEDLFVIRGIGSNVTVLKTDEGAVIVDSMTTVLQGELIRAKVRSLTGQETRLIINTHYHLDHTHGNPAFGKDTRVVSTERTLSHLKALDSSWWEGEAAELLPNETFEDQLSITIGNRELKLLHPGRGHTNGDLVVIIPDEGVVVMGDLLFHQHYPNIDLEAGGSIAEWSATLERVLQEDFTRVVPGHGATTDRLGINQFQRFMGQLTKIGLKAIADEQTLEQVLASPEFTADNGYTKLRFAGISIGLDREFVLRRAWEEATGNFERRN